MEERNFSQETNENLQVSVLSVKDWLITLVITAIPIVGLIFFILMGVWLRYSSQQG